MNPLSPLAKASALRPTVRATTAAGAEIVDQVALGAVSAPEEKPASAVAKAPRSLLGTMMRWAGYTGMVIGGGVSVIGGIAYHANHQAMVAPSTVQLYPQRNAVEQEATPQDSSTTSSSPRATSRSTSSMKVMVPAPTLTQMVERLQETRNLQQLLEQRSQQAEQTLEGLLKEVKVPDAQVLLDATMPLPSGSRSLLHLGSVDLPSLGFRNLQTEAVPLKLAYQTEPITTGIQVEVKTLEVSPDIQGPGIPLGAVQVRLHVPDGELSVRGQMDLDLDLDGQGTRDQIARLQGQPGQQSLIDQLTKRLNQGERLRQLGAEQGFQQLLQEGYDQSLPFEARVKTGDQALATTTLYLWAVPDQSGDGRADIQVTQQQDLSGLDNLQVELTRLGPDGTPAQGRLAGMLHQRVQQGLSQGIRNHLPQVTKDLQKMAGKKAASEFSKGTPKLQEIANQLLAKAYGRTENMTIKTGHTLAPELSAGVRRVEVTPQGLLVDLQTSQGTVGDAEFAPGLKLAPGQAAAALDLGLLNRHLRDASQGGSIHWNQLLDGVKNKAELLELRFGQDSRGKTQPPQLVMRNGQLALEFDIVARMPGVKPTKGATGLVKGATGALDSGMGEVQSALKKEAGGLGAVLGGVLRAPFFVVDKVAEGGKAVIDHTVGKVVDAVPEVATRPTVNTRVSIPLRVYTQQGELHIEARGDSVEFEKARSQVPFDLLDLLPTRLLSNLVVGAVADAQGPEQVGKQVDQRGVELDLTRSLGLHFEDARLSSSGDLTLVIQQTPQTAEWVAQRLGLK